MPHSPAPRLPPLRRRVSNHDGYDSATDCAACPVECWTTAGRRFDGGDIGWPTASSLAVLHDYVATPSASPCSHCRSLAQGWGDDRYSVVVVVAGCCGRRSWTLRSVDGLGGSGTVAEATQHAADSRQSPYAIAPPVFPGGSHRELGIHQERRCCRRQLWGCVPHRRARGVCEIFC